MLKQFLKALYLILYSEVVTCRDFSALPFLAPEGQDFPAVSVVSGRYFPAVAFLAWAI
jgi:hypothetical protein